MIASRWSRDEAVRLADGVVKISGEFSRPGGSHNHPRVCPGGCQPVMLEIRDIPRESLGAERDLEWALVSTYPAAIKTTCDPEWRAIHHGSSRLILVTYREVRARPSAWTSVRSSRMKNFVFARIK